MAKLVVFFIAALPAVSASACLHVDDNEVKNTTGSICFFSSNTAPPNGQVSKGISHSLFFVVGCALASSFIFISVMSLDLQSFISFGVSTADNDDFELSYGYTCTTSSSGCPSNTIIGTVQPEGGSLAGTRYVQMPNIIGCSAYVSVDCTNFFQTCNFHIVLDICNDGSSDVPDWPHLISPFPVSKSGSLTLGASNTYCFEPPYFAEQQYNNATFSYLDVRTTDDDSFEVSVNVRCGGDHKCDNYNLLQYHTYKPSAGAVYVKNQAYPFPYGAWKCIPEIRVHCKNLISTCYFTYSYYYVIYPNQDTSKRPSSAFKFLDQKYLVQGVVERKTNQTLQRQHNKSKSIKHLVVSL